MKKIAFLSLIVSSVLFAGGYKVPESSINAVALGAANVAHNKSADAAYYNPANMIFMDHNGIMEVDMMYIGLSEVDYKSSDATIDISSKSENFLIPSFHYVSPEVDGARYGLSVITPAGLSKRWDSQPAKSTAEEFTLETVEINPTVALPIGNQLAIAIGMRAIYSKGIVRSNTDTGTYRDMEGDSIDFGYNLAISYKATKDLELAMTYRSKVDLKLEGDAKLGVAGVPTYDYDGPAFVEIPVPALLNIAIAYTLPTKTTFEFVYERNYWSSYSELDFNYDSTINPVTDSVFGTVVPKDWEDTNTFRFGITQDMDKLTLMAGLVIDETPIPESTVGYELPDSDSVSVSFGGRYDINDKMNVGLGILYSMREDRVVNNDSLSGEFTNSNVLIISTGLAYKF